MIFKTIGTLIVVIVIAGGAYIVGTKSSDTISPNMDDVHETGEHIDSDNEEHPHDENGGHINDEKEEMKEGMTDTENESDEEDKEVETGTTIVNSAVTDTDPLSLWQAVDAVNDSISLAFDESYFYLSTNSLPDHDTGTFPNSGNPNTIGIVNEEYRIARNPVYNGNAVSSHVFGVALNGIIFEPGTAERDQMTGWNIEGLQTAFPLGMDFNNAHVQPTGLYHYHGVPESAVADDSSIKHSSLVGFAADGFPVYVRYGYDSNKEVVKHVPGWKLKSGTRAADEPSGSYDGTYTQDFEYIAGSGTLDQCNGIKTTTPEYPSGTYAYFLTDEFPYIPRCLNGTADVSFAKGPGAGGQGSGQGTPPGGGPGSGFPPPGGQGFPPPRR